MKKVPTLTGVVTGKEESCWAAGGSVPNAMFGRRGALGAAADGCRSRTALGIVLALVGAGAPYRRVRAPALSASVRVPAVLAVWAAALVEPHAQIGPGCGRSRANGSCWRPRELPDAVAKRVPVVVLFIVPGDVCAGPHVDLAEGGGVAAVC